MSNLIRAGILAVFSFVVYSVWQRREALIERFSGSEGEAEGAKTLAAGPVPHDASHRRRNKLGRGLPDTQIDPKPGVARKVV